MDVPAVTSVEPQYARQTDRMRYFKVMEPSRPDRDIVGMSGCPVFAFSEKPGHDLQVIVCAMQSSWLPTKRILATVDLRYACHQLRAALGSKKAALDRRCSVRSPLRDPACMYHLSLKRATPEKASVCRTGVPLGSPRRSGVGGGRRLLSPATPANLTLQRARSWRGVPCHGRLTGSRPVG